MQAKVKKQKSILAIERPFLNLYCTNREVQNNSLPPGNGNNNPQNNPELDNYLRDLRQRMEYAKNNEVVCACDSCNAERAAASEAERKKEVKNKVKFEGGKVEVLAKERLEAAKEDFDTANDVKPKLDTVEEAFIKEESESGRAGEFAKIRNRILFKRFDDIGAGLSCGYQNTFELMKSPGHVYGLFNLCQNSGWVPMRQPCQAGVAHYSALLPAYNSQ